MKKVIKLTESDLNRIVKRTLKESSYSQMEQQDNQLPDQCSESHLKRVMTAMSENNDLKVKIQTGTDYGVDRSANKVLIITDPDGRVCGCLKKDFFAGGI